MITQFELGWLIGLLEGEGSFGYYGGTQVINLRMVDEDTVNRAANALGQMLESNVIVRVIDPDYSDASRQTVYYLQLYGARARSVMKSIVPFMSYRRRQQIWRALNRYKPSAKILDITALLQ